MLLAWTVGQYVESELNNGYYKNDRELHYSSTYAIQRIIQLHLSQLGPL